MNEWESSPIQSRTSRNGPSVRWLTELRESFSGRESEFLAVAVFTAVHSPGQSRRYRNRYERSGVSDGVESVKLRAILNVARR